MPLGINPLNDFAFQKTFGTPENREPLISLLNAILKPKSPITEVTIMNPFNYRDFQDDKLSILDVKAVDAARSVYDVEVQLRVREGRKSDSCSTAASFSWANSARETRTPIFLRSMESG